MAYIIQAEETEIPLELLQQLAAVLLAESPGLTHPDATYRIHSSHGIMLIADKAGATRISQRFNELGFRNFVVDELLELPKAEHLNLEKPELNEEVELAVVARLTLSTERTVSSLNVKRFSLSLALTGIPLPRAGIEQRTVQESDTRYCLDLFTLTRHWQARPGSRLPIEAVLGSLKTRDPYLSAGAKRLMSGERNLPTFGDEADYEKYVTWLYQSRYARG
jgi:hypothetical protein